jgi:hypothetical protein
MCHAFPLFDLQSIFKTDKIWVKGSFWGLNLGMFQEKVEHFSFSIFRKAAVNFELIFPMSKRAIARICCVWNV